MYFIMSNSRQTLYSRLVDAAREHPAAIALEADGSRFTYARLADLADRAAATILSGSRGKASVVAIDCRARSNAYIAYLGALWAGATVVPLNPGFPIARNSAIMETAHPDVVVYDEPTHDQAKILAMPTNSVPIMISHESLPKTMISRQKLVEGSCATPNDVAYILYTSGSTGRPKGVPIRHSNLCDYLEWCSVQFEIGPGTRVSQGFDLTFDLAALCMFGSWFKGGTVVDLNQDDLLVPSRTVMLRGLTHWFSVPSVIRLAEGLTGLEPGSITGLRWSIFAGDQLEIDSAKSWARAAPNSRLENLYGPTEVTITCTGYALPPLSEEWPSTSNGTVPIGLPHPGLEAALIGDGRSRSKDGELCIRGYQRFDGYVGGSRSEGRFIDISSDGSFESVYGTPSEHHWYRTGDWVAWENGQLVHLGRVDEQVKVNGYRVELGEVERLLKDIPPVTNAVVVAAATRYGAELAAFVTGNVLDVEEISRYLKTLLPPYMIPAAVLHLDAIPLNSNGKVDKSLLRQRWSEHRYPV